MSKFYSYFKIGTKFRKHRLLANNNTTPDSIMTLIGIRERSSCSGDCSHDILGDCPCVSLIFKFEDGHEMSGCPYMTTNVLRSNRIEDKNISGIIPIILLNALVEE